MNRAILAALLGTLLLMTGACKSKTDNKQAIRDAVVKHISGMSGLNVNNMSIVVTQATVNGDSAQANVEIRAKNGDPSMPAMQLSYELQKQGEEWVVLKGQATGGMQHPAPGQVPPSGNLPPGHPGLNGTSGQTGSSQSDFNSILNSAQPSGQQHAPAQQQPATQQPSSGSKP